MSSSRLSLIVLAAVALAFCGFCVSSELEDSDATSYTWTVGTAVDTVLGPTGSRWSGDSVPGVTFTQVVSGMPMIKATGTPTKAGTYTVYAYNSDGSVYQTYNITVTGGSSSTTSYTCYLKYNANGGSGAPSEQSYTGTSKTSHTFTISSTKPTRSGYTFDGWATSSSGSVSYSPGGTISVGYNSTKTLYAVWTQNVTTVSITIYKGNWANFTFNGSTYTNTSKTFTVNSGATIDVDWFGSSSSTSGSQSTGKVTTTTYTSHCYNMVKATSLTYPGGGSDSMSAVSGGKYYPADKMTSSSSTTYYFKVAYNANGGSGAPSTTDGGSSSSSSKSVTLSSTKPTRSGYTFLGWSTSSTATSSSYSSGSSYSFSYGTTTLYAVWKANEPTLAFTSVPDSSCVTLPKITYKDDGSYVIA